MKLRGNVELAKLMPTTSQPTKHKEVIASYNVSKCTITSVVRYGKKRLAMCQCNESTKMKWRGKIEMPNKEIYGLVRAWEGVEASILPKWQRQARYRKVDEIHRTLFSPSLSLSPFLHHTLLRRKHVICSRVVHVIRYFHITFLVFMPQFGFSLLLKFIGRISGPCHTT